MTTVKKAALGLAVVAVSAVLVIGATFTAELVFRAFFYGASAGYRVDAALFPYQPYLVSVQPKNLRLGGGGHLLDKYFSHSKECDAPGGVTAQFNSLGFRSPEFTGLPPKEENELRVVVTGGSVAVSWNIGEACTLDRKLEKILSEKFPNKKVRVFNLASAAWKSFQELIAIQLYGLDIRPDAVIALDGFNDVQHSFSMDIRQPYSGYMIQTAFSDYVGKLRAGPGQLLSQISFVGRIREFLNRRPVGAGSSEKAGQDLPLTATGSGPGKMSTRPQFPLDPEALARRTDFDPYAREVVNSYRDNLSTMTKSVDGVGAKIIFAI